MRRGLLIDGFNRWLILEKGCASKTTYNAVHYLKTLKGLLGKKVFNLKNCLAVIQCLRQEKKSPYHIKQLRYTIYLYCEYLINKKKLKTNFAKKIPIPKTQQTIPQVLTPEEIKKIIEMPARKLYRKSDCLWNSFFGLLAKTGMRLGEVRNLKVSDLDFSNETILIRETKTKEKRLIPIPPDMTSHLLKWTNSWKPTEWLYQSPRGNKVCEEVAQKTLRKRAKKVGITKRVYPHLLRHSFITELLRQDIAISKVQRLVGHKKVNTTMTYTHLVIDDLRQAMFAHPLIKTSINPKRILKKIKKDIENYKLDEDDRFSFELLENTWGIKVNIFLR